MTVAEAPPLRETRLYGAFIAPAAARIVNAVRKTREGTPWTPETPARFIRALREERGLTQRQLADALGATDKAVSKWERGGGCPTPSFCPACPNAWELRGNAARRPPGRRCPNGRNHETHRIPRLPACGNVIVTTGDAECPAAAGAPRSRCPPADEAHAVHVEPIEGDWYVTRPRMNKQHHLGFVAVVGF